MTTTELQARASALAEEIQTLSDLEDPTEEQVQRLADAINESTPLADEIRAAEEAEAEEVRKAEERKAALDTIRSFAARPSHTAPPAGPTLAREERDPFNLDEIRGGLTIEDRGRELRSRAHSVIERHLPEYVTDEMRSEIARKVDTEPLGGIARHVIEHSAPGYEEAFLTYMRTGEIDREMRATLTTGASSGGVLLPTHLDPTIILTNAGTTNPFRQISRVESTTFHAFNVVTSAGITAEWLPETSEAADKTPTVSGVTITPAKAAAYVEISREEVQDTNVASQLPPLFADARDVLEGTAFATGSGSTSQPYGVLTQLQNNTATSMVSAQTNGSFGAVDVFGLVNNLPARWQRNCSWVAHWFTYNLARQFGGANQPNFWVDLGPGIPSQMLGRPTYISEALTNAGGTTGLSSATSSNDDILILGDFSQYVIVDRIGMEVLFEPIVKGSNRRPTGNVGYVAFWRTGANIATANAFRFLRV